MTSETDRWFFVVILRFVVLLHSPGTWGPHLRPFKNIGTGKCSVAVTSYPKADAGDRPFRVRKRPSAGGLQSTVADRPDVDGHGSVPSMWCSSQSVAHYFLYSSRWQAGSTHRYATRSAQLGSPGYFRANDQDPFLW
jgi:hypothetical protein